MKRVHNVSTISIQLESIFRQKKKCESKTDCLDLDTASVVFMTFCQRKRKLTTAPSSCDCETTDRNRNVTQKLIV